MGKKSQIQPKRRRIIYQEKCVKTNSYAICTVDNVVSPFQKNKALLFAQPVIVFHIEDAESMEAIWMLLSDQTVNSVFFWLLSTGWMIKVEKEKSAWTSVRAEVGSATGEMAH